MGDILLTVMMLAVFPFGYFVADRFGKIMEENHRAYQGLQALNRKIYITVTEGKSAGTISREVRALLDSLPDRDEYEIIICKTLDAGTIERLERSGCTIEYDLRR